jgi:hypothetical protein
VHKWASARGAHIEPFAGLSCQLIAAQQCAARRHWCRASLPGCSASHGAGGHSRGGAAGAFGAPRCSTSPRPGTPDLAAVGGGLGPVAATNGRGVQRASAWLCFSCQSGSVLK